MPNNDKGLMGSPQGGMEVSIAGWDEGTCKSTSAGKVAMLSGGGTSCSIVAGVRSASIATSGSSGLPNGKGAWAGTLEAELESGVGTLGIAIAWLTGASPPMGPRTETVSGGDCSADGKAVSLTSRVRSPASTTPCLTDVADEKD